MIISHIPFKIKLIASSLLLILNSTLSAQNVDPNFKPVIKGVPDVTSIHTLPDGKIIIGGNISSAGSRPTKAVLRLNADGILDNSFQPPFYLVSPGRIMSIEVDNDNKILVGAFQQKLDGTSHLVRLNQDGSLDPSFSNKFTLQNISKIKALANGKYLVSSTTFLHSVGLNRLNNDGSIDETFDPYKEHFGMYTGPFEIQEDGKIICAIHYTSTAGQAVAKLVRLNLNGDLDNTFETGTCEDSEHSTSLIYDIKIQSDGKIVIAGMFKKYKDHEASSIIRLNNDGTIDPSFINPSPLNSFINRSQNTSIEIWEDNKILVSGFGFENEYFNRVILLNTDGTIDNSFEPVSFKLPAATNIHPLLGITTDKIYVIGDHLSLNNQMCMGIAAIDNTGSLMTDFLPDLGGNPVVSAIYHEKNGKIVIGGVFSKVDSIFTNNIVRFNKDGSVDTVFTKNLGSGVDLEIKTIAYQSDSSIIIGGDFLYVDGTYTGLLARIKPDGKLDKDFKAKVNQKYLGEGVNKIIVDTLDNIIIGGVFDYVNDQQRIGLAFLFPDGQLNSSIASDPILPHNQFWIHDMAYQSDKKLIVGGEIVNETDIGFLVKLDDSGVVDPNFHNSVANVRVSSIDILNDDRIIVGNVLLGYESSYIAQLDANGNILDSTSVSVYQKEEGFPEVNSIQHAGEDQLIIGGRFSSVNGVVKPALIKVSLNGDVDEYFKYDVDGRIMRFFQEDSTHLFVAGSFNRIGNDNDLFCIARIDINFPNKPTDLSGKSSSKKADQSKGITLNWKDQSTNESGFSIEKSLNKESFSKVAAVSNNTFSYIDQAVDADKKYYYRVKAYNTNGGSSYSNIFEIYNATTIVTSIDNLNEVLVSSNPGEGYLRLLFKGYEKQNTEVEIFSVAGKLIYKRSILVDSEYYQLPVDISNEPNGIYFIKVASNMVTKSIKYIKY